MLAENTLLKTTYHFLLLLVGFDTLTYQKGYDRSPILVGHQQGYEILRKIHEGDCGLHAGSKSLVAKALLMGFIV